MDFPDTVRFDGTVLMPLFVRFVSTENVSSHVVEFHTCLTSAVFPVVYCFLVTKLFIVTTWKGEAERGGLRESLHKYKYEHF